MGQVDTERSAGPDMEGRRWEFDESVADAFTSMLEKSIPMYGAMRKAVTDLAASFVRPGGARSGVVVDLGASRGDGLAPLVDRLGAHARYFAVEASPPMLEALSARWPAAEERGHGVSVFDFDLRKTLPLAGLPAADVTLLVLTLQFVPIEHRHRVLRDVWRNTRPGGALILVEKVLGATADLDAKFVERYLDLKGENGYSPESIERKRLSLEGVLVPVTAAMDEDFLRAAGFRDVDCFYAWMNFRGWLAVKDV